MFKRANNILLLLIITQFIATSVLSHVLHYKELNKLEFDLYRNDKLIGKTGEIDESCPEYIKLALANLP